MPSPAETLAATKPKRPQPTPLKREMDRLHLTYADVGKGAGVHGSIVRTAALGISQPRVGVAIKLAAFFGQSVEALFGEAQS